MIVLVANGCKIFVSLFP